MTKRNRLDDFHALQGVLDTKTLKIDVNHGSARRGLLRVVQLTSWISVAILARNRRGGKQVLIPHVLIPDPDPDRKKIHLRRAASNIIPQGFSAEMATQVVGVL